MILVTPFIGDVVTKRPCYPIERSYTYQFELQEPVGGRPIEFGVPQSR